jgi:hypothetical protein
MTASLGYVKVRGGKDGKGKGGARRWRVWLSMYSITENICYSQLSSVALLLQPESVSHRIIQGKDWVLSPYVLSSFCLPLPSTCLPVTVNEARSYFASTILTNRRTCVQTGRAKTDGQALKINATFVVSARYNFCSIKFIPNQTVWQTNHSLPNTTPSIYQVIRVVSVSSPHFLHIGCTGHHVYTFPVQTGIRTWSSHVTGTTNASNEVLHEKPLLTHVW